MYNISSFDVRELKIIWQQIYFLWAFDCIIRKRIIITKELCINKTEFWSWNNIKIATQIKLEMETLMIYNFTRYQYFTQYKKTRPLEWLLDKCELKLARLPVAIDKNGDFRAQLENDVMMRRLLRNAALLRIINEILQKPICQQNCTLIHFPPT
jgi:hypothetical protein